MTHSKKIVVPNDFSIKPLILLKKILENNPEQNFDIMLLHGIYPPDCISDLLFYSKIRVIKEMENEEFVRACNLFKNSFRSRITAMYADVITSVRKDALDAFLEVNEIEEIYLPEGLEFTFRNNQSFNLIPLLEKAAIPVKIVAFESVPQVATSTPGELSGLFINELTKTLIKPYQSSAALS